MSRSVRKILVFSFGVAFLTSCASEANQKNDRNQKQDLPQPEERRSDEEPRRDDSAVCLAEYSLRPTLDSLEDTGRIPSPNHTFEIENPSRCDNAVFKYTITPLRGFSIELNHTYTQDACHAGERDVVFSWVDTISGEKVYQKQGTLYALKKDVPYILEVTVANVSSCSSFSGGFGAYALRVQ